MWCGTNYYRVRGCISFVLGSWVFWVPSRKCQLDCPKVGFPTQKVGGTLPTRTSRESKMTKVDLTWLDYSTHQAVIILFCLIGISLSQSYTQYCPICGHVATVFVYAKHHVMCCYQLVLLTMANLTRNVWLIADSGFLTSCNETSSTWLWRHSQP